MSMSQYVFPGVWPFIERIAAATGRDLHQAGRTRSLWHVGQVQDALGQLPRVPSAHQPELLAHARKVRESLALALEGVDAAIAEVAAACGLTGPTPAAEPTAQPMPAPGSARKVK